MKKDLVKILACPVCKQELKLEIREERKGEVLTGSLTCANCHHSYPIKDGIPNLLPPETSAKAGADRAKTQ